MVRTSSRIGRIAELLNEVDSEIRRIFLILSHPEIPQRGGKGAVIEYLHEHRQRNIVLESVIAKSLPQGMAGYPYIQVELLAGCADDAVGLGAADGFAGFRVHENAAAGNCGIGGEVFQCAADGEVERDALGLASLLFDDIDRRADAPIVEIVDIVPGQIQDVADAQRGVYRKYEKHMVADFTTVEKVRCKQLDILFASYRMCRSHGSFPPKYNIKPM